MIRNYFLINLLLVIVIYFLGSEFYKVYVHRAEIPTEAAPIGAVNDAGSVQGQDRPIDPSLFQIISNMDIFRPSRSPYKEEPSKFIQKIPPRLFGTIILGNEKSAILEDPTLKTTRLYKVNEEIGGYTIADILEDKVVLAADSEKTEIRLREEKRGLPPVQQFVPPQPVPQIPPQVAQPVTPQQPRPQVAPQPAIPQQPVQRPLPQRRPIPQRPIPPTPVPR